MAAEVNMPWWGWYLLPGAIVVPAWLLGPVLQWFLGDRFGFKTWFFLTSAALWLICCVVVMGLFSAFVESIRHAMAARAANRPPPWERCERCGYNLIASRDRCPECGRAIPPWPMDQPRIRVVRGFVIVGRRRE